MRFYRGIAYGFLGDQAARDYAPAFTYLGQGRIFGSLIPFSVVLFVILAIIFGLVLHRTAFGRYLYAIGNNEDVGDLLRRPRRQDHLDPLYLVGSYVRIGGLILAARFGSTRPDIGTGLELAVITAAVLGGVDINGGIGTMLGAGFSLL